MKLSIHNQLLGGFAIDLLLMLILGVFALAQMGTMNERATLVENRTIPSLDTISKVNAIITSYRSLQLEFIINNSAADQERLEQEMGRLEADMLGHFQSYDELLDDQAEPAAFQRVQQAWQSFVEANHQRFLPLARQGNTGTVQPIFNRLNPLYSELLSASRLLNEANQQQASEALGVVQSSYWTSRYVILGETAVTLLVSALIGVGLATRISRRVRRLSRATQEVAQGDLERQVEGLGDDEIGMLARHFNQMTESLRQQRITLELRNQELQASLMRQQQLTEDLIRGKQAEESAYRAQAAAEAASQAKSMFLATMSHELRTPLTAILGYTQLIWLDPAVRGYPEILAALERVRVAGKHLLTIINNILDFSRIEQGKMYLHPASFDLAQLAQDVIAIIAPLAQEHDNQLRLDLAPDLGSVYTDATKLRQILFNLLSNATKFTQQGDITLRVQRVVGDVLDAEPLIRFDVADTGIGIASDQLHRLFQPFSQLDATVTRRYDGTGLGLALSNELCKLMGGSISVASELHVGSVFTVILPVALALPEDQLLLAQSTQ